MKNEASSSSPARSDVMSLTSLQSGLCFITCAIIDRYSVRTSSDCSEAPSRSAGKTVRSRMSDGSELLLISINLRNV